VVLGAQVTSTSASCVGVSDLSTLGIWVCARRSIGPRRARVQRRGRPISEKELVILECNEAFENTELSPWNVPVVPVERRLPPTPLRARAPRGHTRTAWLHNETGYDVDQAAGRQRAGQPQAQPGRRPVADPGREHVGGGDGVGGRRAPAGG